MSGATATGNPYRPDLERFEKLAREPDTRMTFLCTPQNPVGRVWTPGELTAFAEIAARHGLIVVADEIHGDLMLDGRRFTPWLSLEHPAGLRSVVCLGAEQDVSTSRASSPRASSSRTTRCAPPTGMPATGPASTE